MRKTVIALNLIVAVFFTAFLTYTFVARFHLNSLARRFVTEKPVQYSMPVVELAEKSLDFPIVRQLLAPRVRRPFGGRSISIARTRSLSLPI